LDLANDEVDVLVMTLCSPKSFASQDGLAVHLRPVVVECPNW